MTEYVRKNGSRDAVEVLGGKGTFKQVLVGPEEAPNFAMRRFIMEPHGGMPKHTNLVEHEQYILEGSATVEIGDRSFEVEACDSVYIPGLMPHSYKAGADGFEFICVVPNQEDRVEIVK